MSVSPSSRNFHFNDGLWRAIREDIASTVQKEVQDIARTIQKEFDGFRRVLEGRIQTVSARCELAQDELDDRQTDFQYVIGGVVRRVTDLDDWAAECTKEVDNSTVGRPKCELILDVALCNGSAKDADNCADITPKRGHALDVVRCEVNDKVADHYTDGPSKHEGYLDVALCNDGALKREHALDMALCVAPSNVVPELSLNPVVPAPSPFASSTSWCLPASSLREPSTSHRGVSPLEVVPELTPAPPPTPGSIPVTALRKPSALDPIISVAEEPAPTLREPPTSVSPAPPPLTVPTLDPGVSEAEKRLRALFPQASAPVDEAKSGSEDLACSPQSNFSGHSGSKLFSSMGQSEGSCKKVDFAVQDESMVRLTTLSSGDAPSRLVSLGSATSDVLIALDSRSSPHRCQFGPDIWTSSISLEEHIHAGGYSDQPEIVKAFQHVENGDMREVQRFLESGGDPNARLLHFQGKKKLFADCCLLPIAVIGESLDVVRLLIEFRASLDSTYGFRAGALGIDWSGNALHAAASRGNLDMMKELVQRRGDVHALSSNRANLVWQCCYHGHLSVLNYMLHHQVSHHLAAQSQDVENATFTPLHISTLQGHRLIVEKLLDAKADANRKNQQGHTPLIDAIICCLPEVVCLLISHGAKLVDCVLGDQLHTIGGGYRILQYLFLERNPVLVEAAARGLRDQEAQTRALSTKHVLQFMTTGDSGAMRAIFQAIFRRREIFFRGESYEKIALRLAQLPAERNSFFWRHPVHTCETPYTFADVTRWFVKRQRPDKDAQHFFNGLLPQEQRWFDCRRHHLTSVVVVESLVPDFHKDIQVLNAIATLSQFDPIFETKQCRAIISCNWHTIRHFYGLQLAAHASLLLIFFISSVLMRDHCVGDAPCPYDEGRHNTLRALAVMGMPCVLHEIMMEIMEFVVSARYGSLYEYLQDWGNLLDVGRIMADCWVLLSVFIWSVQASYYTRIIFAACCFYKWLKLLYQLTPIRGLGEHVMPIIFAVRNIMPFLGVMLFYLGGMGHAYTALRFGKIHVLDGALEIISFGLNQEDLPTQILGADFRFDAVQLRITKLFVLLCTFMLPIALMNTFIAAMVESYTKGIENIERLYQSRVAHCVMSQMACKVCLRSLGDKFRHTIPAGSDDTGSRPTYLWFCYERRKTAWENS